MENIFEVNQEVTSAEFHESRPQLTFALLGAITNMSGSHWFFKIGAQKPMQYNIYK